MQTNLGRCELFTYDAVSRLQGLSMHWDALDEDLGVPSIFWSRGLRQFSSLLCRSTCAVWQCKQVGRCFVQDGVSRSSLCCFAARIQDAVLSCKRGFDLSRTLPDTSNPPLSPAFDISKLALGITESLGNMLQDLATEYIVYSPQGPHA